jgi:hypothetical protein
MIVSDLEMYCPEIPIEAHHHNNYPIIIKIYTVFPIFKGRSMRVVIMDGA